MKIVQLVLSLALTFSMSAQAGFMPVANLTKIQGTILSNNEKMKVGDEVAEGMDLKVLKGMAEIKFQNGHLLRLVGAKIKVETINPKNTVLMLEKGQIYAKVLPMTTDETFVLKTERAGLTMNGTSALIEERQKSTSVLAMDGQLKVQQNPRNPGAIVNKGEILTIVKKEQELRPIAALKKRLQKEGPVFLDMH